MPSPTSDNSPQPKTELFPTPGDTCSEELSEKDAKEFIPPHWLHGLALLGACGAVGSVAYLTYRGLQALRPSPTPPPNTDLKKWVATTWGAFSDAVSRQNVRFLIHQNGAIYYKDAAGQHYVTGLLPGSAQWLFDHMKLIPTVLSFPTASSWGNHPFREILLAPGLEELPPIPSPVPLSQDTDLGGNDVSGGTTSPSRWNRTLSRLLDTGFPTLTLLVVTAASLWSEWPWGNHSFLGRRVDSRIGANNGNQKVVRFTDIVGHQKTKAELTQIIQFLKNPEITLRLGARIPRGILLEGQSGTGKTLLARAVASEAQVPFFYVSASNFVEIYVGQGAARVRQFFQQARRNAPCVLFIDEIDALGTSRSTLGGNNHEYVQTLNQLLTEMDGLEKHLESQGTFVIVMAATNRYEALDEALTRPGRFDRIVTLKLPTSEEREELCKLHTKTKRIDHGSVRFRSIAELTEGWTGAEIECLFNEAALLAARSGSDAIKARHVAEVISILHQRRKRAYAAEHNRRLNSENDRLGSELRRIVLWLIAPNGYNSVPLASCVYRQAPPASPPTKTQSARALNRDRKNHNPAQQCNFSRSKRSTSSTAQKICENPQRQPQDSV